MLVAVLAAGSFVSCGFTFRKDKKAQAQKKAEELKQAEAAAAAQDQSMPPITVTEGPAAAQASATNEEIEKLKKDHADLQDQYKHLEEDRDNVLAQTRLLLSEKSGLTEMQDKYIRLKRISQKLASHSESLQKKFRRVTDRATADTAETGSLRQEVVTLGSKYRELESENEQLSLALAEKIDNDPEFRRLADEINVLKRENKDLVQAQRQRERDQDKALQAMKSLQERNTKQEKEIADQKEKYKKLLTEKADIIEEARQLKGKYEATPQKMREMADQNDTLIRETSEMHYNLGVFFTENRKINRAVKEFERALDFNPNNAKVHYNLGYLYSQELKQHDEAMAHFKKFLEIEPGSKESEEIRNYMLVREAYGDSAVPNNITN